MIEETKLYKASSNVKKLIETPLETTKNSAVIEISDFDFTFSFTSAYAAVFKIHKYILSDRKMLPTVGALLRPHQIMKTCKEIFVKSLSESNFRQKQLEEKLKSLEFIDAEFQRLLQEIATTCIFFIKLLIVKKSKRLK